jgi:hypothetical protein
MKKEGGMIGRDDDELLRGGFIDGSAGLADRRWDGKERKSFPPEGSEDPQPPLLQKLDLCLKAGLATGESEFSFVGVELISRRPAREKVKNPTSKPLSLCLGKAFAEEAASRSDEGVTFEILLLSRSFPKKSLMDRTLLRTLSPNPLPISKRTF